ncbi:MAG: DUF1624 domain-containing protein [Bacteroidetes bacterium]|nr:DUF1624 domain-containing protein [Bacteroidota bacterium]
MHTLVTAKRFESIDLLRGIVIVLMALDHVRDYFHADSFLFDPLDLAQTNAAIFFTRWITHYCAPIFIFLAGTSIYIVGKRKGKAEVSSFLLKRGFWLMFLEFTVMNFAWFFNIHFSIITLQVIWAIGLCMVCMAAIIHLPFRGILWFGLVLIVGHNLLDGITVTQPGWKAVWAVLHQFEIFPNAIGNSTIILVYPLIPWVGVMSLGYCLGALYASDFDADIRKRILRLTGLVAIALFILVRFINFYGDPDPRVTEGSGLIQFLSFLNVSKYPPSMLYLFMTLGPALLFLAYTENLKNKITDNLIIFGRVPMFFYILHVYVIHLFAMFAAQLTGYGWQSFLLERFPTKDPALAGYGFSLGITYLVWIFVVLVTFPICKWYNNYKSNHREKWWLSYL